MIKLSWRLSASLHLPFTEKKASESIFEQFQGLFYTVFMESGIFQNQTRREEGAKNKNPSQPARKSLQVIMK